MNASSCVTDYDGSGSGSGVACIYSRGYIRMFWHIYCILLHYFRGYFDVFVDYWIIGFIGLLERESKTTVHVP